MRQQLNAVGARRALYERLQGGVPRGSLRHFGRQPEELCRMTGRRFGFSPRSTSSSATVVSRRSATRWGLGGVHVLVLIVVIAIAVSGGLSKGTVTATAPLAVADPYTQVPGLPPNATCPVVYTDVVKPFDAGTRGTPMTSCPFVEQVRRAYALQNPAGVGTQPIRAVSPTTHKAYDMICTTEGGYVSCVGGQGAIVYLYNN